jgi:adenylosuccinate synthase
MGVTAVVGANWGDEGKGKMIDNLAAQADIVVRFQGGHNAGHTVINEYGRFALHLLPSGVFYPQVTNIIGPGVALDIPSFFAEYDDLIDKGVPQPKVLISQRTQVVLKYHRLFDELEEERLKERQFGSTKSGIAPFYSDKCLKVGIQVADLFDLKKLKEKIEQVLTAKNVLITELYKKPPLTAESVLEELLPYVSRLKEHVGDTTQILHRALAEDKNIILEGQLGALRDPDHGIYPFTTSSSTLAGYASIGAGIPPYAINRVIALVKAYSSCVGAGPFVTELIGPEGEELRRRGGDRGEYGATTGRPRRVGWFDAVASRYGCLIQGATEVALTLIDVLGYLDQIPVCTAYEIEGRKIVDFPVTDELEKARPVYEYLPGWECGISHIRDYDQLPKAVCDYVEFIEKQIGIPVRWLSVGPQRDCLIHR